MKKHYVSYSQAVKLKELGFKDKCNAYYWTEDKIFDCTNSIVHKNSDTCQIVVMAPFLWQAQAWMRELGALHINVYPVIPFNKWKFNLDDLGQSVNPTNGELNCRITEEMTEKFEDGWYDTYESALSAGISKALELLGKEVKK